MPERPRIEVSVGSMGSLDARAILHIRAPGNSAPQLHQQRNSLEAELRSSEEWMLLHR
ncbi:hypothetical protein J7L65_01700 [Candidatus Bathyarchaeota archaeon]|nr:hypothetical protein [Candidatus Bathyarchaeota archaeon]